MKNKSKFIVLALIILISVIGISYAFFEYYKVGTNQKLIFGEIYLKMNEGTDTITLTNVFPETAEEARKRTDNQITFTISGINTTTNKDIWYEIMLNEGNVVSGRTRFNPEDLVFDLVEVNADKTETYLVDAKSFGDIKAKRIWVETVNKNTTSEVNKTYKLRMWLREDVFISDTNPNATYDVETFESSYASVKVSVYGDFVEKELPVSLAKKMEQTITLTEPDVDGTRFVYGNTVNNNYVWYSGKLWRIVSIDKDGSIKLVTQNNMTSIAWNTTSSTDYSTSQIRSWLNNEFLPTLENRDALLGDYEWDYTTYAEFPTQKATENIMKLTGENAEKVGLLNIYEYMMTCGYSSSATYTKTFLNNTYFWWTMTPKTDDLLVWFVSSSNISNMNSKSVYGVRPAVNVKSGITILSGNGEITNPYTIEGDKATGTTSELLSNRISGEYINFNNTKYRIVGIETINGQQLTKVTMADYDDNKKSVLTTSQKFGNSSRDVNYNTSTGIGKYLLDWYNATEESDIEGTYTGIYISDTYKKMIATSGDEGDGVYWWIGSGTSSLDYKLSKTGTKILTPIGLGYYGEILSSQFGNGLNSSSYIWLMTKYNNSYVWYLNAANLAGYDSYTNSFGARPSFYLKSNVVIGDTNGDGKVGTGMPHDPYEIVQLTE